MKIAAVLALAKLAKEPVPDIVAAAYNDNDITFGREYLIPKALDPRLISCISAAVAKAAIESGVARKEITDWKAYMAELESRMGRDDKLMRAIRSKVVTAAPRRIAFSEESVCRRSRPPYIWPTRTSPCRCLWAAGPRSTRCSARII